MEFCACGAGFHRYIFVLYSIHCRFVRVILTKITCTVGGTPDTAAESTSSSASATVSPVQSSAQQSTPFTSGQTPSTHQAPPPQLGQHQSTHQAPLSHPGRAASNTNHLPISTAHRYIK